MFLKYRNTYMEAMCFNWLFTFLTQSEKKLQETYFTKCKIFVQLYNSINAHNLKKHV